MRRISSSDAITLRQVFSLPASPLVEADLLTCAGVNSKGRPFYRPYSAQEFVQPFEKVRAHNCYQRSNALRSVSNRKSASSCVRTIRWCICLQRNATTWPTLSHKSAARALSAFCALNLAVCEQDVKAESFSSTQMRNRLHQGVPFPVRSISTLISQEQN